MQVGSASCSSKEQAIVFMLKFCTLAVRVVCMCCTVVVNFNRWGLLGQGSCILIVKNNDLTLYVRVGTYLCAVLTGKRMRMAIFL